MPLVSAYAPGRIELLGNHTDYNEGVVLGAAIDRGITVQGEKRDDDRIVISSDAMGRVEIEAGALSPLTEHRWRIMLSASRTSSARSAFR